jgi:hypothetical protein
MEVATVKLPEEFVPYVGSLRSFELPPGPPVALFHRMFTLVIVAAVLFGLLMAALTVLLLTVEKEVIVGDWQAGAVVGVEVGV